MIPYFTHLLSLLETEREADQAQYQQLTQHSSAADRRSSGLTWYPLAIRSTEPTRGEYISVELERTTHHDLSHQFRFGSLVTLFSHHDPTNDREEGVITYVGGNRMKVTFRTDELPDWAGDGKLGIDLLFDNNSYDEMRNAVKAAAVLKQDLDEGELIRVLVGEETISFGLPAAGFRPQTADPAGLNASQQQAVDHILSPAALSIIHGPPGTGKTTTLVQAIKALYARDQQQILVVAPSNTAVDLLSEKLAGEGMNVLRVGNPARVSEHLLALTLDGKLAAHPEMKALKKLKKQASEYKNMAHKYKRKFGRAEQEQRKALFSEAHKITREVSTAEEFLIDAIVNTTQVVTATLVGSNHYTVSKQKYHTLVIDEAGQALEPACWIPILKAKKVVMAGDPFQLPPTIKSPEAARKGLGTTLLEKCIASHPGSVTLLTEQYRMNSAIMGYSSQVFYQGLVQAHPTVANRLLFPGDAPLLFIDTAGAGFDEKLEGTSSTNPEEAAFLARYLQQLLAETGSGPNFDPNQLPTIAIISPYKEQVRLLNDHLIHSPFTGTRLLSLNTVDGFQGQERDIVLISLVRSNASGDIGFLADLRRMNVAMTRAKKKLVVIGDSATLSRLAFYAGFIEYAEGLGGYKSVWEFGV